MTTAQKIRGRRAVAAAALAVMALGATGCGAINPQATTANYAPSDGISLDIGDVQVRNLMMVTNSAEEEARLLGSLVNSTENAQSLTLSVNDNSVTIDVPAKTTKKLEDDANKAILPSAGAEPGANADVTVAIDGISSQEAVPVVNGALAEYRPYLPGGYDETTVQHLEHTEDGEGGH